ncbi:MAG: hypothetical protein B6U95_07710 [Thermofilum sp. ex4484_82]|nr:MAG: hypothetical protein B6U95_07710 [Thermofilum sp. ex4484_82]OYT36958.1 MAG: hypothetical protein B6U96_07710 [Archaeoglobales archaeon ex4484_92]
MNFIHLRFHGETTSPWYVGKKKYGDYLYTRTDYLWGRGVRGPVLRQLWRTYCFKSDLMEKVDFVPERDCTKCSNAEKCPFNNLRGTGNGDFKDKPRLIVANLFFKGDIRTEIVPLATLNDQHKHVVKGKAPVYVEYIPSGVRFEFEIILMGNGVRFVGDVEKAVRVSLSFFGWGGLCNEGFGRGVINNVEKRSFKQFEEKFILPIAEKLMNVKEASFNIVPLLLLEKSNGNIYTNIFEDGFEEKLTHSINERYWQFYDENIYVPIRRVSGKARTIKITGWSRTGKNATFTGIGNELKLHFERKLNLEEAKAIAITRYGIGKYKNQGFGSLRLKPNTCIFKSR